MGRLLELLGGEPTKTAIPPDSVGKSLVYQESRGNPLAISPKGARGKWQIMPETGMEIAEELGEEYSEEKLFDPDTSERWGKYYLEKNTKRFGGDLRFGLIAYHAGPDGAQEIYNDYLMTGIFNVPRTPRFWDGSIYTADYVDQVMSRVGEQPEAKPQRGGKLFQLLEEELGETERERARLGAGPDVEFDYKQYAIDLLNRKKPVETHMPTVTDGARDAGASATGSPQVIDSASDVGVSAGRDVGIPLQDKQYADPGVVKQRLIEEGDPGMPATWGEVAGASFEIMGRQTVGGVVKGVGRRVQKSQERSERIQKKFDEWQAMGKDAPPPEEFFSRDEWSSIIAFGPKAIPKEMGEAGKKLRKKAGEFQEGASERAKKVYEEASTGPMLPKDIKNPQDWDKAAKTWISAISGTAPYMAVASIPYAGTPMIMMSMGEDFYDQAEKLGIPDEVANEYANAYGIAAGLVEKAQAAMNIKGAKELAKPVRKSVVKILGKILGESAIEGLEEVTQGGLEVLLLNAAIKSAQAKDKDWQPKGLPPKYTWERAIREFGTGAVIGMLMEGTGATIGEANRQVEEEYRKKAREESIAARVRERGKGFTDEAQRLEAAGGTYPIGPGLDALRTPGDEGPPLPPREVLRPGGALPPIGAGVFQEEQRRKAESVRQANEEAERVRKIKEASEEAEKAIRRAEQQRVRAEAKERKKGMEKELEPKPEPEPEKPLAEMVKEKYGDKTPTKNQVREEFGVTREEAGQAIREMYRTKDEGARLAQLAGTKFKRVEGDEYVFEEQGEEFRGVTIEDVIGRQEEIIQEKGVEKPKRSKDYEYTTEGLTDEEYEDIGERFPELAKKEENKRFQEGVTGIISPTYSFELPEADNTTLQIKPGASDEDIRSHIDKKLKDFGKTKEPEVDVEEESEVEPEAKAKEEVKPEPKPTEQKYYQRMAQPEGGHVFKEVEGSPVEIEGYEGIPFFMQKTDEGYAVVGTFSGQLISSADNPDPETAIEETKNRLSAINDSAGIVDRATRNVVERSIEKGIYPEDLRQQWEEYQKKGEKPGDIDRDALVERATKELPYEFTPVEYAEVVGDSWDNVRMSRGGKRLRQFNNFIEKYLGNVTDERLQNQNDPKYVSAKYGNLSVEKQRAIVDHIRLLRAAQREGVEVPSEIWDEYADYNDVLSKGVEQKPLTPEEKKKLALEKFRQKQDQRNKGKAPPAQPPVVKPPSPPKGPVVKPPSEPSAKPPIGVDVQKRDEAMRKASENLKRLMKSFEERDPNKLYMAGTEQAEIAFELVSNLVEAGYYEFKIIAKEIAKMAGDFAKRKDFQEAIEDAYDAYSEVDEAVSKRESRWEETDETVGKDGEGESEGSEPETVPKPEGEGEPGGDVSPEGEAGEGPVRKPGRKGTPGKRGKGGGTGGISDLPPRGSSRQGADGRWDYRISEADNLGVGGQTVKYRDNVAAVRLLKKLEAENRWATPEEQKVLVRYVGWGPVKYAFTPGTSEYAELKELLTEEEFRAADQSAENAHYTSPEVVTGMWNAVMRMGYFGGPTMEPATGVGHFWGLRPNADIEMHGIERDNLSAGIAKQLYQSANIINMSYEDYKMPQGQYNLMISNVPFSSSRPVEGRKSTTPGLKRGGYALHNFYFLKSLHGVRDGGLVAFITSHYTMDAQTSAPVRKMIADQADFIGAIRLPQTAFKGMANTEVVTDIIFLQKRAAGTKASDLTKSFIGGKTVSLKDKDGNLVRHWVNNYFLDHPEMIIGEQVAQGTMYREGEYTVAFNGSHDEYLEAYRDAVDRLPRDIVNIVDQNTNEMDTSVDVSFDPESVPPGGYASDPVTGEIYQKDDETGKLVRVKVKGDVLDRIKGMVKIRATARKLFNNQGEGKNVEDLLSELNKTYDDFVATRGNLHFRDNVRAFAEDPDADFLLALEDVEEIPGEVITKGKNKGKRSSSKYKYTKSDVFSGKVFVRPEIVTSVDDISDAVVASQYKYGRLDFRYISDLYGKSEGEVIEELLGSRQIFEDHETFLSGEGNDPVYIARNEYLSGNVRKKHRDALEAAEKDAKFRPNAEALESVIPKDVEAKDISIRINSPLFSEEDVAEFVGTLIDDVSSRDIRVTYSQSLGRWNIRISRRGTASQVQRYGTKRMQAGNIIQTLLSDQVPMVYDIVVEYDEFGRRIEKRVFNETETELAQQKSELIKEAFNRWVWADPDRTKSIADRYNWQYNCMATGDETHPLRVKDKNAKVYFPGSSAPWPARAHQADAVWRVIRNKMNMLAHVVGSGKTATMVWAAMEMKRLGLRKKSLVVVPNHMTDQWHKDVYSLYPNAKVLVSKKGNFTPSKRRQFMNRMATGDWDIIIMRQSHYKSLPVSPEFFSDFANRQIEMYVAELRVLQQGANKRESGKLQKMIRRRIEKLKNRVKRLESAKDEGVVFFDQMGIDQLFVDEADMYKNLEYMTSMQNVRGLGQQSGSQQAFDMLTKVRYIQSINGGVTFATGTPISNTLVEAYSMMRFLQPDFLAENNIDTFDAWQRMFAGKATNQELNNTGTKYIPVTRFTKIVNLPELLAVMRQVWDIKTAKYLSDNGILVSGKHLPNVDTRFIQAPATPELRSFLRFLELREDAIKARGKVGLSIDNVLVVIGDGKKAAMDLRMIHPSLPDNPQSKMNMTIDEMYKVYKESEAERGTIVLFADNFRMRSREGIGVDFDADENVAEESEGKGETNDIDENEVGGEVLFDAFEEIRQKLTAKGVKPDEIKTIHEANTDARKQKLFDDMNSGRVRILLGTTGKMGAGTNIQARLKAMFHLDAPWRPRDIEQRNGRIVRQGNTNDEVYIYYTSTKGSLDAGLWNILQTKAELIERIMSGEVVERELEEEYYKSAKELAIDDPEIKEMMEVREKLKKLERAKRAFDIEQSSAKGDIARYEAQREEAKEKLSQYKEDAALRPEEPKGDNYKITVEGKEYTKMSEAGAVLRGIAAKLGDPQSMPVHDFQDIGEFAGFKVTARSSTSIYSVHRMVGNEYKSVGKSREVTFHVHVKNRLYKKAFEPWKDDDALKIPKMIRSILYEQVDNSITNAEGEIVDAEERIAAAKEIVSRSDEITSQIPPLRAREKELDASLKEKEELKPKDPPGQYDWERLTGRPLLQRQEQREESGDEEIGENKILDSLVPDPTPAASIPPPAPRTRVETVRKIPSGSRKKYMEASRELEDKIQFYPKDHGQESGWLSYSEKQTHNWVDSTLSIKKIVDVLKDAGYEEGHPIYKEAAKIEADIDKAVHVEGTIQEYLRTKWDPIIAEYMPTRGVAGKLRLNARERGERHRELVKYLVAKRAQWLYDHKRIEDFREAGLSKEQSDAFVEIVENGSHPLSGEILKTAKKIWDYKDGLKEIKREAGIIDEELFNKLNEPYYVPFYHELSGEAIKAERSGKRHVFYATGTGIKGIRGSKRAENKIVDVFHIIPIQTRETISNARKGAVAQRIIDIAELSPEVFGDLIYKMKPKWFKSGFIEHRIQIDAVLRPKLEAYIKSRGINLTYKARMRKKLGQMAIGAMGKEMQVLMGASENTMAHELGHELDYTHKWIRPMLESHKAEFQAIAESRYSGESVPIAYQKYVNQSDEVVAEFISLYLTARPTLKKFAPDSFAAFEAKIRNIPDLAPLLDMEPSNVDTFRNFEETNWVMQNDPRVLAAADDVIATRKDGKLVYYRVPIEMGQAVKSLDPIRLPVFVKWLVYFNRILRAGATSLNMSFMIPNIFRDQMDAAFNAGTIPFTNIWAGARHFIAKDEVWTNHAMSGGLMDAAESGYTASSRNVAQRVYGFEGGKYLDRYYWQTHGIARGTLDASAYFISAPFKQFFRPIRYLSEMSEMSTRLGVFEASLKKGQTAEEAVHTALNATIDFQKAGYIGRGVNECVPFFNAAVQGLDRYVATWKNHTGRAFIFTGFMLSAYFMLYGWNRRFRKYREIPDREKATNWILMLNEEDYIKIPKAHTVKFILNPIQMAVEVADGRSPYTEVGGPKLGKGFGDDATTLWGKTMIMVEDFSPISASNAVPSLAKVLIEDATNYDLYWQQQIVKPYLKGTPGEEFDRRTSTTLRKVGRALNLSPMLMQHSIQGIFGGTGKDMLWLTDWALSATGAVKEPIYGVDRASVVRRFYSQAQKWKSDLAFRERELKSVRHDLIEKIRSKAQTRAKMRYADHSQKDILRERKKMIKTLQRVNKKLNQIREAQKEIIPFAERFKK